MNLNDYDFDPIDFNQGISPRLGETITQFRYSIRNNKNRPLLEKGFVEVINNELELLGSDNRITIEELKAIQKNDTIPERFLIDAIIEIINFFEGEDEHNTLKEYYTAAIAKIEKSYDLALNPEKERRTPKQVAIEKKDKKTEKPIIDFLKQTKPDDNFKTILRYCKSCSGLSEREITEQAPEIKNLHNKLQPYKLANITFDDIIHFYEVFEVGKLSKKLEAENTDSTSPSLKQKYFSLAYRYLLTREANINIVNKKDIDNFLTKLEASNILTPTESKTIQNDNKNIRQAALSRRQTMTIREKIINANNAAIMVTASIKNNGALTANLNDTQKQTLSYMIESIDIQNKASRQGLQKAFLEKCKEFGLDIKTQQRTTKNTENGNRFSRNKAEQFSR